ncbi:antibiotic biosynthesis monooxygenase [Comamonas piscis]|uniref:Antibiotic biosynthesis monooxygenase n=1 Tax=Comamonas piscis TaxID=1562974 RepID=A0A7G5EEG3_9BURK|nr:putative quinol monooxygenase [Comamonas piscis]QMV72388.1 antibiotic biosynthesis monooxygenase [Comamonas piscis]WSO35156.1 putative quinol monooxygenase [Comamonas piscis]
MTEPLNLIVTLQPHVGRLPDVVSTLATLAEASLQEAGCLRYDVAVGEELVYLFEVWTDREALAAHEKEPHFVLGVAALNRLCESLKLEFVEWQAQG